MLIYTVWELCPCLVYGINLNRAYMSDREDKNLKCMMGYAEVFIAANEELSPLPKSHAT